ncbi:hypothetical protein ABFT80_06065 [Mesorhizobium sp. SB112]|uniref:hypothetical protein n=1 Tax=Mesorhizobium sp. SB112 TaxID=3151853 RepID=UPI003266528B
MDRNDNEQLDLIWGVEAIGNLIGRNYQQAHHMLSTGKLPAKQVGDRWVASRSKLTAFFMEDAA